MRTHLISSIVFYFLLFALTPCFQAPAFADVLSVYQDEREKQIEDLRNDEIRTIRAALSLRSPENRKAELYLRLSELYMESYRANFLLEGRKMEAELKKNPQARLVRIRTPDDLRLGTAALEQILKFNISSERLDQVYFFLGFNYGELEQTEKSLSHYQKVVDLYPQSKYYTDSLRILADQYFKMGQFSKAEVYLKSLLGKTTDRSVQARVHHRLAWCAYRSKRTDQAISEMKRAIQMSQGDQEKFVLVREDGLKDISIFFAENTPVDEAMEYLKENSPSEEKKIQSFERLGREYERSGKSESAQRVYQSMVGFDPNSESAFRVQVKMIDLDLLKSNFVRAVERIKTIPLQGIPESKQTETKQAYVSLKNSVRKNAVEAHERFRKQEDPEKKVTELRVADQFYGLYLNRFLPQNAENMTERNEVRMYWAEVKTELKEPADASKLYQAVIRDQDPKYSEQAAQLWLGSLNEALKQKAKEKQASGDSASSSSSPSDLENDFVEASDWVQRSIPKSEESKEARVRSAQILAAYSSEKTRAYAIAKKLVTDFPDSKQAVLAARLMVQLEPTQETLNFLGGNPSLLEADRRNKGELNIEMAIAARQLKVSRIASLEKNRDFKTAATEYEEFARSAKTEKEAEGAYLGALQAYASGGSSEYVFRVMAEWRQKFPKSLILEKSVKAQATQFFIRGLYKDSAEVFYAIGKQFNDRSALWSASALFEGGLDRKKAIEVHQLLLSQTKGDEEKAKIYRSMASLAEGLKDPVQAMMYFRSCANLGSSLQAECHSQLGNGYLRIGEDDQARKQFEAAVSIKSGPSKKSPYIAYAQFRIAQNQERRMKFAPLEFPEEKLLKAFQERVEELRPVTSLYQKALELGGPWGLAAAERLGDLSLRFSQDVSQVLKAIESNENLKAALLPVADQLRSKALDQAKKAYQLAVKEIIFSPAVPVLHDRLAEARVDQYQISQGDRLGLKLIGVSPDSSIAKVRERLQKNNDDPNAWNDYGNTLWGEGRPGLSKIAYEKSLSLQNKNADALNNLAIVLLSDLGYENWVASNEAYQVWKRALQLEANHSASLYNLGHLLNYYRIFKPALDYFLKAERKVQIPETYLGIAVAYEGMGQRADAKLYFEKSSSLAPPTSSFSFQYSHPDGKEDCQGLLKRIMKPTELKGFEKISFERLKERCEA